MWYLCGWWCHSHPTCCHQRSHLCQQQRHLLLRYGQISMHYFILTPRKALPMVCIIYPYYIPQPLRSFYFLPNSVKIMICGEGTAVEETIAELRWNSLSIIRQQPCLLWSFKTCGFVLRGGNSLGKRFCNVRIINSKPNICDINLDPVLVICSPSLSLSLSLLTLKENILIL